MGLCWFSISLPTGDSSDFNRGGWIETNNPRESSCFAFCSATIIFVLRAAAQGGRAAGRETLCVLPLD